MTVERVVTIYYRHRRGGHCKRLYMMISALLKEGFEVHYVSAENFLIPAHPNLVAHIVPLPIKKREGFWFWLFFSLLAPFALLRASASKRPVAIAVFDPNYSLMAKLASLLCRTKIVLFMRAVPWRVHLADRRSEIVRSFLSLIDYSGLRAAHKVVAVTAAMQKELETHIPALRKRLVTLPNSVIYPEAFELDESACAAPGVFDFWRSGFIARKREVAERFSLSEKNFFVVTVGELTERRNVETLVRAVGALENDRVQLIICGAGPEITRLETISVGLGLTERVVFSGWLEDPTTVVSGCDLFVFPSRHEGMSNSLLEAIGAGVAVIAADTPEMREVLQENQLLFEPGHVDNLARKLGELIEHRESLRRIQQICQDRSRLFCFDWGKEVVNLLQSVAK